MARGGLATGRDGARVRFELRDDASRSAKGRLQPPRHQQDDHDDEDDSHAAAWIVAPAAAMRPSRESAEQEKNEDDQEDCSNHCTPMLRGSGRDEAIASAESEIVALDPLAQKHGGSAQGKEVSRQPPWGKGLPGWKH